MRPKRLKFGLVTALGVVALSVVTVRQTKSGGAVALNAGSHAACQVKTTGADRRSS